MVVLLCSGGWANAEYCNQSLSSPTRPIPSQSGIALTDVLSSMSFPSSPRQFYRDGALSSNVVALNSQAPQTESTNPFARPLTNQFVALPTAILTKFRSPSHLVDPHPLPPPHPLILIPSVLCVALSPPIPTSQGSAHWLMSMTRMRNQSTCQPSLSSFPPPPARVTVALTPYCLCVQSLAVDLRPQPHHSAYVAPSVPLYHLC